MGLHGVGVRAANLLPTARDKGRIEPHMLGLLSGCQQQQFTGGKDAVERIEIMRIISAILC